MSAAAPEVVVIGAGAAGLAAARELARAGIPTLVLEARPRLFGRIHTLHDPVWPGAVELGAEFVHGEAPITTRLAQHVAAPLEVVPDRHRRTAHGHAAVLRDPDTMLKRYLKSIGRRDQSLAAVLARHPRAHAGDVETIRLYVQGFHAAEIDKIGARALQVLVGAPSTNRQQRPVNGYDELLRRLAEALTRNGVVFRTSSPVTRVRWTRDRARVDLANRRCIDVRAVVLTVPLSLLQARAIALDPFPTTWPQALARLHMGPARKIALLFARKFWNDPAILRRLGSGHVAPNFWHAPEESLPTWWTSAPRETPVLTAWAGGPRAAALSGLTTDALADRALASLAHLLAVPRARIDAQFVGARTHDWGSDPWTRGGYSYVGVGGLAAQRELARPVDSTLVLAGEALDRTHIGTVEGALASGRRAARALLRSWRA